MESYLSMSHFDLVTPDGLIVEKKGDRLALVRIEGISPAFVGFHLPHNLIQFNLKSSVAQLGINAKVRNLSLDQKKLTAEVEIELSSIGPLAEKLLPHLTPSCLIGKLFAADPTRRVRDPDYLLRMFGRKDRDERPLLSFGGTEKSDKMILKKIEDRTIAFLKLQKGVIEYDKETLGFLPTFANALKTPKIETRQLLKLHQIWNEKAARKIKEDDILLVRTLPLHIRTVFAHVVDELLPDGVYHTLANVLQPDTMHSGDVYELYGKSDEEITTIPLEFYTLEPHREHVFFQDRDQLQTSLEDPKAIFKAFDTAPKKDLSAVFVVKGEQMLKLKESDWITRPVLERGTDIQKFIKDQPSYLFLKAIEQGHITSQGVLFTRYFPSPLMKKMLLGDLVQTSLKGLYFQYPSYSNGQFFSHEDRTTLLDLANFNIPIYWADEVCGKILQFALKPEKDTGMFVPIDKVETFIKSTVIGVYGSTLVKLKFGEILSGILRGLLNMRDQYHHPLFNKDTTLSLITGGGPGVMEVGNRVARDLNILSCANIVDFRGKEQEENPYIEAKMTYRIDRLVERQGEFNLDFPIFLVGGFGTDFELALEEVRRKVEIKPPTPALLLGPPEYWEEKITSHFRANLKAGTIAGSEWVSNCFYCIETAEEALEVYTQYFSGNLPIGPNAPASDLGFMILKTPG